MFAVMALHSLPRSLSVTLHSVCFPGTALKKVLLVLSNCSSRPEKEAVFLIGRLRDSSE